MANKTNFFVVSIIAMMAACPAFAETSATQEWVKDRYDSKISTINQRMATDVRDKIYNYDSNKNSPTYKQVLDPLHTEAETAFSGINEVLEKVDGTNGTANSAVTLNTTAQNAFGAINELKTSIDNINVPDVSDMETQTHAAATYQPIGSYATTAQLNAKADASDIADMETQTHAAATYQPIGSYATTAQLNAKADASDIADMETQTHAAATYQEKLSEGQLAAVGSGVTSTTVAQVGANKQAIAILDSGKQNTIDSEHPLAAELVDGLATVATSGSYADLENKPEIPAAQVNADWTAESGVAQILHKPEIPAAQVQSDWSQSDNTAVDFIKNKPTLAAVATSGDYEDLSNTPNIPTQVQSDWSQSDNTAVDFIKNKPTLATVATSGSYADLSNKPSIPTVDDTLDATSHNAIENAAVVAALEDKADASLIGDLGESATVVEAIEAAALEAGNIDLTSYVKKSDVESSLSSSSTNPVQNKVVKSALDLKADKTGVYPKTVNVPDSGQYVLGFVDGVQTYIPIVDANGVSGEPVVAQVTE